MKLRFFCDLCGTEVPRNTIRCPTCGRYFTAIQCPRCRFRGEEKDFAQGCPKCGYMKIPRTAVTDGQSKKARKRRRATADVTAEQPGPSAPAAVYRLVGLILTVVLIALVVILFLR
jgi:predicted RNA-binding Zn-ribbon protein involved in translation (DUF1610 family)